MRDSINEVNGVRRFTPSKKYRRVCVAIMAVVVAIMSILIALVYPYAGLFIAVAGVLLVAFGYWISGLRFYYIRDDGLITKKLFTDASVSTPFRNIGEIGKRLAQIRRAKDVEERARHVGEGQLKRAVRQDDCIGQGHGRHGLPWRVKGINLILC